MPAENKKIKAFTLYFLSLALLLFIPACSSKKSAVKTEPADIAESNLQEANKKIEDGFHEDGREILQKIKEQDTSGKYIALAQIRIADSYFQEKLYDESAVEYGQFLKLYPHHKYAPYAQYQLATSYFNRIKTVDVSYSTAQTALQEFEKLLNVYPRNPYVAVVENRIKMCKRILADYEFYVGNFYFKKGSYGAAAMRFNTLLQTYPDSMKEPDALFYLGLSYKNMNEIDKALKTLTTLVEKYPAIKLSKEAKEILASLERNEK
jgi:outer membrane protein assembly factor BamD